MKRNFALLFYWKALLWQIQLNNGEHSCNFDQGSCSGWSQNDQDDFDWRVHRGYSLSYGTGPSSDHGGNGSYMYMHTYPRKRGDKAMLEYSVPSSDIGKMSCLTFYYHMYGPTVNALNVYNGNKTVFSKLGDQGFIWLKAKISLILQSNVSFEGIATPYQGDIGLDDVSIIDGMCQECIENVSQSFGRLNIKYTSKFDPHCNFFLGNTGIATERSVIVSIQRMNFRYCGEYVKVIDGDGEEVLGLHGCDPFFNETFREIPVGNLTRITIQILLAHQSSFVEIHYSTLKQALDSASLLNGWNVSVVKRTVKSLGIRWTDMTSHLSEGFRQYIVVARKNTSSVLSGKIMPPNVTSSEIGVLYGLTEYHIAVVGINSDGIPLKSKDVLAITDEGKPSLAPPNVRLSRSQLLKIKVEWEALPEWFVNGRRLGYKVTCYEWGRFFSYEFLKTIDTSPKTHQVTLDGLREAKSYRIWVAAFTSKGVGLRSRWKYITTGCGGFLNQSIGRLVMSSRRGYQPCTWVIGNSGVSSAVALISVQDLELWDWTNYIKIIDGDGSLAFSYYGNFSSWKKITEVNFGKTGNITIQFTADTLANLKLHYGIIKRKIKSALLEPSWNVTLTQAKAKSLMVNWTNLTAAIQQHMAGYFVLVHNASGTIIDTVFASGNASQLNILGLTPYTEYHLRVIGISSDGKPYNSSTITAWTDEAVPYGYPTNLDVSNIQYDGIKVEWDPVPRQYTNGRILGYRVYYGIYRGSYMRNTGSVSYNTLNISGADVHTLILRNLSAPERYRIRMTAFTSKGEGPQSVWEDITTGCEGGFIDQSFGQLRQFQVGSSIGVLCTWKLDSLDTRQAVALFWLQEIHSLRWIQIYDGDDQSHLYGQNPYSLRGEFLEVNFGLKGAIWARVKSYTIDTRFKMLYLTMRQNIQSAPVVKTWNISFESSPKEITFRWPSLTEVINQRVLHYVCVLSNSSGTIINTVLAFSNDSYAVIGGLSPYTEYKAKVVGINSDGQPYKSHEMRVKTKDDIPHTAPLNVRLTRLQFDEVKIQWDPIPQHSFKGQLLGYIVYYCRPPNIRRSYTDICNYQSIAEEYGAVTISRPDVNMTVLSGLKAVESYKVSVAGFSSTGAGPKSSWYGFQTGCGGVTNKSFGQLQIDSDREQWALSCTLVISGVSTKQAVAILYLQELALLYNLREYWKIVDGNGIVAYEKYGYFMLLQETVLPVHFGAIGKISLAYSLSSTISNFKLQYLIVKQDDPSALLIPDWSVTVSSVTTTTMKVHWENVTSVINQGITRYVVVISNSSGVIPNSLFVPGNTISVDVLELSPYMKYQVTVVGVYGRGKTCKSSHVTVWTKEGVPSRAPSGIKLSNEKFNDVKVLWDPLPMQYINGKLLGYRVFYQEDTFRESPLESVDTRNPFVNTVTLKGLKTGLTYRIQIAAFTSEGVGPKSSYWQDITVGCQGNLDQSFAQLQVDARFYGDPLKCSWSISNLGMSQAVALILLQNLTLLNKNEYLNIIDGHDAVVVNESGYLSSPRRTLIEVHFGKAASVNIQVYLTSTISEFKLQFIIIKRGLHSASLIPDWQLTLDTISTSLVQWGNLTSLLKRQIPFYIVILNRNCGILMFHEIIRGSKLTLTISRAYPVRTCTAEVFGVDEKGQLYRTIKDVASTQKLPTTLHGHVLAVITGAVGAVIGAAILIVIALLWARRFWQNRRLFGDGLVQVPANNSRLIAYGVSTETECKITSKESVF